jgi:hypothetical protein
MNEPVLFKVVDDETAKTVAFFDSFPQARECVFRLVTEFPEREDVLVLVAMAKDGHPLGGFSPEDLEKVLDVDDLPLPA